MADLLMRMPMTYEPKKTNRFILTFQNELGINSWYVESAKRPNIKIDTKEIKFLNTQTYVAGFFNWETIDVTFRDPIGPSAAQAVMEWVRLHHESVTGRDGYSDFYKKDLTIDILGPVGDIVSEWILKGAFITEAKFSDLSWDEDAAAQEITVTLAMDYAVLNF